MSTHMSSPMPMHMPMHMSTRMSTRMSTHMPSHMSFTPVCSHTLGPPQLPAPCRVTPLHNPRHATQPEARHRGLCPAGQARRGPCEPPARGCPECDRPTHPGLHVLDAAHTIACARASARAKHRSGALKWLSSSRRGASRKNNSPASMPFKKVAMAFSLSSWLGALRLRLRESERVIVRRIGQYKYSYYSKLEMIGSDLSSLIWPRRSYQ